MLLKMKAVNVRLMELVRLRCPKCGRSLIIVREYMCRNKCVLEP